MKSILGKTISRTLAAASLAAGLLVLSACGGGSAGNEVQIATSATPVQVSLATVRSVEGVTFAMPAGAFSGVPALAAQATTVRFTNTASATPTGTIIAGTGTATTETTFGSCIFKVTASTIPGLTVGTTFTINVCNINAQTQGLQANGQATTVAILLQLGTIPSAAAQATVSINRETGVVTINNVSTGTSATLTVVPATGTGGG